MATWDDIHAVASRYPEVTAEGRAWRLKTVGLAWERPLRKADLAALGDAAPTGPILGIRTVDLAAKDELLAAAPDVFFTTPHFDGYPAVLARLDGLEPAVFEDLFREVWLTRATKRAIRAWQSTS